MVKVWSVSGSPVSVTVTLEAGETLMKVGSNPNSDTDMSNETVDPDEVRSTAPRSLTGSSSTTGIVGEGLGSGVGLGVAAMVVSTGVG